MDTLSTNLVRAIESKKGSRVVHMVCEFVSDPDLSRVWLLRTTECLTAIDGKRATNKLTSEQQKLLRSSSAPSIGDVLTHKRNEIQAAVMSGSMGRSGMGGHVEERIQRRRMKERDGLDEGEVQRLMDELERNEHSHRKRRARPVSDLNESTQASLQAKELASSSAASKALGSSQLSGCPGDFCGSSVVSDCEVQWN